MSDERPLDEQECKFKFAFLMLLKIEYQINDLTEQVTLLSQEVRRLKELADKWPTQRLDGK